MKSRLFFFAKGCSVRRRIPVRLLPLVLVALICMAFVGCSSKPQKPIVPAVKLQRTGDEIMVCGQMFHIGTPVVLWMDPGGYDAYRVEKRFGPTSQASWEATTQKSKIIAGTDPPQLW